jgi:hypothetical protein|tara:strand:- start:758 stop:1783 length:1026 start_codon:yes stop_codon:yes gene_type:complete
MNKRLKLYDLLRKESLTLFEGAHNVHTPKALTITVLDNLTLTNCKILVLFNVEFVISLVDIYNIDPANITFYSDHKNKSNLVNRFGVKYINTLEKDMKFDIIVGNPPYTNGQKLLYTKFFETALELAETVVFVMPVQLDSNHDKLKFHNARLQRHLVKLGDNVSNSFKVGYDNIHYVIANSSINNVVKEYVDPVESIPLLYPNRARLSPIKGDTDIAIGDNVLNGIPAVFKVHKGDQIIYKNVEQSKIDKTSKKSSSPYLVFVNHTPSKGKFNCAVLANNNNISWGMWTFAFECQTEKEANKLKEWLQSKTIVDDISKMLTARNNQHTISKALIERLPFYE